MPTNRKTYIIAELVRLTSNLHMYIIGNIMKGDKIPLRRTREKNQRYTIADKSLINRIKCKKKKKKEEINTVRFLEEIEIFAPPIEV